ncbi:MAG: FKBP-type peptidyl-prolyl cis-trans isomerase [Terricaulis sp.]
MRFVLLAVALVSLAACDQQSSVMDEIERAEKQEASDAEAAVTNSQAFLETARARPGVEARPSGLLLEFTHHGSNNALPHPGPDAMVLVHYEGKLANGETFDSSISRGEPAQFPLNQVVPGFSEAIQLMRPGDEIIAYFPPELGYGASGSPPMIPPNAALQFRIQLLAFQGADGRTVMAPRP